MKSYHNLKKTLLFSLALLLLTPAFATADTRQSINWIMENFEPFYIQSGPFKNQGIGDRLNQALIEAIPEYQHKTEYLPVLRITSLLKEGAPIAVNSYLKNPQDKDFAIYSITSLVVPPLELTLRKKDWENHWNSSKTISLASFLERKYNLSVAKRRYYGDNLMPLFFDGENYKEGVLAENISHYKSFAEMVALGRADATIGYAAELDFFIKSRPQKQAALHQPLVSIPIVENTEYLFAYVVMANTPQGRSMIKTVNRVLKRIRQTPKYKAMLLDWFGATPEYTAIMEQRFNSDE